MKFGSRISEIRLNKNITLREMGFRLRRISITKYSKIEREIQNPNEEEFTDIIRALELSDKNLINELYELSKEVIPVRIMTEEEILKELPLFVNPNELTEDKLKILMDGIIESNTPE